MKFLSQQGYVGKSVILGIRPEDIHAEHAFIETSSTAFITIRIDAVELTGAELMVYSCIDSQNLKVRLDSHASVKSGDTLGSALDLNKAHFFDIDTEVRIRPFNDNQF